MVKNYLKIALRNLMKYKLYSMINILGLALGIASFLIVLLFIKNEVSYDQFNQKKDRIYRLDHNDWAILGTAYGDLVKENFPEVENTVRFDIWSAGSAVIKKEETMYKVDDLIFADASVFEVFTLPFVQGNPAQALNEPFTIVLTRSIANRIFNHENPVGKTLRYNNQYDFIVTGLIEDVRHSHLPVKAIASFQSLKTIYDDEHFLEHFGAWNYPTFLLTHPGTDVKALTFKLNNYFSSYESYFWNKEEGPQFHLTSLNELYFNDDIKFGYGLHGSRQRIALVTALAGFILLIACFNFINLTTARASMRYREVGIRKVLGSSRLRLIFQMLIESIVVCAISFMLAFGLADKLLPHLNTLFETSLSLKDFNPAELFMILIPGILILGLFAGVYPAIQMTSFNTASILKSSRNRDKRSARFRRMLIGFQFVLSVMLIIGTLVISKQLDYLKNKNLGFEKSHIVILPVNKDIREHWQAFKTGLTSNPGIQDVTFSYFSLGEVGWIQNWDMDGTQVQSNLLHIDPEFVPFMDIDVIEGRNFSWDKKADEWRSYLINEEMARQLTGRIVGRTLGNGTIIGVVKDFHFNSLKNKISPLVLVWGSDNMRFANIKIAPLQMTGSLKKIESVWQKFSPEFPFEYSFLDKRIENIYKSEQRLSMLFSTFSMMALLIACIGLSGLSAFLTANRTREIALRKVLGASVIQIIMILSREFSTIVIVANLIAWPVIYFISNRLLQSFAYHTDIDGWIFVFTGAVTLCIALLTVSWQAVRAATANPIEALRYE